MTPRIDTVFATLVAGFCDAPMTNSAPLRVSDAFTDINRVSVDALPFLLLQTGPVTFAEWDTPFVSQVMLTVLGQLKVKAVQGEADKALRVALDDVLSRMARLRGLWVDNETGKPVPFSSDALKAAREGKIKALAFRAGPLLRLATPRPQTDAGFAVADLQIGVEFLDDFDPTVYPDPAGTLLSAPPMIMGSIGAMVRPPNGPQFLPMADPSLPFAEQLPVTAPEGDTRRQTFYAGPDVDPSGRVYPPFSGNLSGTLNIGSDPVKEVLVLPRTLALAVPATSQLTGIAIRVSGATELVTRSGAWTSSSPTKATVSSTGLVTAVAAGTSTITCAYGGASGTCAVTVS